MGRRLKPREINAGSDSFLDVIANIVGILIILIVMAGVRVSQSPVLKMPAPRNTASLPPEATATPVAEAEPAEPAVVEPEVVPEPEPEPEPVMEPLPEEPVGPPEELVRRAEELRAELAALDAESARLAARYSELSARHEQEHAQLASVLRVLEARKEETELQQNSLEALQANLAEKRAIRDSLVKELEALEEAEPDVKRIQHRITPISRSVKGDEIHFRLAENRVAKVPLDELRERLLRQAQRQQDWLQKFHQHQGTVGPVGGFRMEYVIERQPLSPLDRSRYGANGFRAVVTGFKLVPESDLKSATAEEALRAGSEFHTTILRAAPNSTVTFWVYPDSFEIYRRLQAAVHEAGLNVAARPLPFGVPIAGSPHGTRSAAQ